MPAAEYKKRVVGLFKNPLKVLEKSRKLLVQVMGQEDFDKFIEDGKIEVRHEKGLSVVAKFFIIRGDKWQGVRCVDAKNVLNGYIPL